MKTPRAQLSASLQKTLKQYPVPEVDRAILSRALALTIKPNLKVWPMLIAAALGFVVFMTMLHAITTDYATGVVSMASYVSLPLTLILTTAATLLKLSTDYGNWLLAGTLLFIGFEMVVNRRLLFHMLKTEETQAAQAAFM